MDAATLARVAEPFFTSKPAGKGMGLGAFLAHLLATRMGGSLTYDSAPGRGTTAMMNLPLHVH
jgi:signal transduction histidine kinase